MISAARSGDRIEFYIPASFFEDTPLYKFYPLPKLGVPTTLNMIGIPSITMECPQCTSTQTFIEVNQPYEGFRYANYPSNGAIIRSRFACGRCQQFTRQFFIWLDSEKSQIMKVGQFPAWEIHGNKRIEKLLGTRRNFWRRGLICESQSFGIAAFSYYRRIVELIISDLLKDVKELIPENELPSYEEALLRIQSEQHASEKIAIAKELLPSSLRPGGINPLGALYKTLSEGIHSLDDEECLRLAEQIRVILVFLIQQIEGAKEQRRSFAESMKKLLDKK
jgi:hypothetical protein